VLDAQHGRLLVRPAQTLAGLLEIRGLGIRRLPYEPLAQVGLIVDLGPPGAARLPAPEEGCTEISGLILPRLAVALADGAVPVLLAFLRTEMAGD
jgi:serine kinase of HPr protein (carbohydrate metabolism regulator)